MTERRRVDIVNVNFFDWNGDKPFTGGAERYVVELAELLRRLGASPRILQNAYRPFEREYAGIPVVGLAATATMNFAAMSAAFGEAAKDAALVIASPFELALGLGIEAPVIGINHGIDWDLPGNRFEAHDHSIERWIVDSVRACRLCVCVDTNFYNWLRCLDGETASRLRHIPNFVDLELFAPSDKRFDGTHLEVLFPRRLCEQRGFRDLVEAFDDLLPRHPELMLHVCGSGPEEDEAIARAFVARHAGRVRWSELEMQQMRSAYATSHIVLVPTVYGEGTSLSCIEAMATNNAIVTTPVGGLPNLVIDGYNGIVVAPGPRGIVDAVERLLGDRALLERLARTSLDVVPAFAKDRWTSRWKDALGFAAPLLFGGAKDLAVDPYREVAWPHSFRAERARMLADRDQLATELGTARLEARHANEARTQTDQRLMWVESELNGIKTSTGWALLQVLYRIRFALFPRGSRRDAAGRWLMHRGRAVVAWWRLRRAVQDVGSSPDDSGATSRAIAGATAVPGQTFETAYSLVCLPILEWSFRFQRPQQLARRFARAGHDVLFAKHSFGVALSARPIEAGIEEVELPGTAGTNPYRDRMSDVDAERMADALLEHLGRRGIGRFVVIVQLPFWAPLAVALRTRTGCDVVYDCMDLHAGFSSNTDEALSDEARLFGEADLVVGSSPQLVALAAPHARRTVLVRNGVDYDHFAGVADRLSPPDGTLTLGYYGAIADWFDSALVAEIARLRPQWRIVLIGSTWSADTAPFEAAPKIELPGEKPYADLPALIADWDCCFIPFRHTPLTEATNPVKVYEMLAAGKPVVSVRLPELISMGEAGLVALAEGADAFVRAIEHEVSANSATAIAARRSYAAANTWQARAKALEAAIDEIRPLVSVIVVTFGNRELNELCLASVLGDTDYPEVELIVVDNASTDGTPQYLRALAERNSHVSIILNTDNKGFSAANNQGAAIARGRYLCFLNNDTVVHGGWLATLVAHLRRHARLGLVGPVTNAIANEAKIAVEYGELAGMPAFADAYCAAHRGELRDISMLAFFCVVMPRHVWQRVGPLDESFGTGMFEDDDYNRRVRAAGFDVKVAHDAFVHHWQMASFKLLGNEEYLRIYRENQARYAAKWRDAPQASFDPLDRLRQLAETAPGTVIFAPSVGWAIPLAQRPHHLARVLASEGYVAVFDCSNSPEPVDTLRQVEPRLFLYKGAAQRLAGLPRSTLWTFSYNYDYRDAFPADTTVIYDWIDDLSVFPYDQGKLAALHARAMRDANVVLSVARQLHTRAVAEREDARYVPNAVEEGRFEREPQPNPALDDPVFGPLISTGRPIAGYYGALANWFDYALLAQTAKRRPDWSFVLIGPDHDGSLARSKISRLQNVHWLGPKPYETLPGYLHRFDVAMIPFAINDITLATSPLKLFEYFAAQRPVISTAMPECAAFDVVRVVHDVEEFAAALDEARARGRDAAFRARLAAIAKENTWRARAREAMAAVAKARGDESFLPRVPSDARSVAAAEVSAVALTHRLDEPGIVARRAVSQVDAAFQRPQQNAQPAVATVPRPASPCVESPVPAALARKLFVRGICNVCGVSSRFFRDDPSLDRESMTCEHCRTTSRYRSIAKGVLRAIQARTGIRAEALARLPESADAAMRVFDTQAPFRFEPCAYPIPDLLRRCRWIDVTVSSYKPDRPLGEMLEPQVVNQDLEQLTFADESFDLVVTSDVMEHVRLDDRAHREIARVLKPGGVYLFTVPHFRDRHDTYVRVRVQDPEDPSKDEYLVPPEYHGDANAPGGRGALSYRSYGTVLDDDLRALGFDVSYTLENDEAHGIRNAELFYCVKRGVTGSA